MTTVTVIPATIVENMASGRKTHLKILVGKRHGRGNSTKCNPKKYLFKNLDKNLIILNLLLNILLMD